MGFILGLGDWGLTDIYNNSVSLYNMLLDLCNDQLDWENVQNKPELYTKSETYSKEEVDDLIDGVSAGAPPFEISDVTGLQTALNDRYTESETDALLDGKANTVHTHDVEDIIGLSDAIASMGVQIVSELPFPVENGKIYMLFPDGADKFSTYITVSGNYVALDAVTTQALTTALASKQNKLVGTDAQYVKGDGSYGSFNKAAIGLGNLPNLLPADWPISDAVAAALANKANSSDTLNKTGNQTKTSGVLTFAVSPKVPNPTDSDDAVNKGYFTGFIDDLFAGNVTIGGDLSILGELIVSSTNMVTNLNAEFLNGKTDADFAPADHSLGYHDDVLISTPTLGQLLRYNGTMWANWTPTYEGSITAGTSAQYFRGDKSWQTLNTAAVPELTNLYFTEARVRATPLTGFSASNAAIVATDTVLQGFNKAQGQLNNKINIESYTADANAIAGTGFYYADNVTTNVPAQYVSIIEAKRMTDRRGQIAFDAIGTTGRAWIRTQGAGAAYSSWNEIITTGNQATLTRGTGLTGSNYSPNSAATWAIDFGTGATQVAAGNHTHTFASLTSKPTTLSGYGITDAAPLVHTHTASQVTDFTTAARLTLSGTGAISYNNSTGVISYTGTTGTVTSVGLSAPTGFSVSNSPVISSGTLALSFAAGYSLPSDATQATWTAKQAALSGTGLVKSTSGTISYITDNSVNWDTLYSAFVPAGSSDLNTNISTGVRQWPNTATNTPVSGSYGTLFTFVGGTTSGISGQATNSWINQLGATTGDRLYFRQSIFSTSSWTTWKKLWTEEDNALVPSGVGSNMNSVVSTGVRQWNNTTTNSPVSSSYGTVLTFVGGAFTGISGQATNSWINQLAADTSGGLYYRQSVGDWTIWGSWARILTSSSILTGFSATNSAITGADTILQGFNKAQGQINNRFGGSVTTGYVPYASGSFTLADTTIQYSSSLIGIGVRPQNHPLHVAYPFAKTDTTTRLIGFFGSNEINNAHGISIQGVGHASSQSSRRVIFEVVENNTIAAGTLNLLPTAGSVVIGSQNVGSDKLELTGSFRYSGTLKPSGSTGSSGQFLKTSGSANSWASLSSSDLSDGVPNTRTISVLGTSGRITSSAGAQSLAADRTWTLDLVTTSIVPGAYTKPTFDAYGRATIGGNIADTDITSALGFTPVPTSRTLTINGTTYDLSLNRSWTIPTITGSGTTNYLVMWNSGALTNSPLLVNGGQLISTYAWSIHPTSSYQFLVEPGGNYVDVSWFDNAGTSGWQISRASTGYFLFNEYTSGIYNTRFEFRTGGVAKFYSRVKGSDPANSDEFTTMGWIQSNTVTSARTLTINGTTYDLSADRSWTISGGSGITSVAMTVPTGLQVSGSPITTSGTLAVSFASGYSIPTTTKQSDWDAKVPGTRTITINGTSYDLSADRSWTISGGGSGISGSGTSNYFAVWSSSSSVTNGSLYYSGGYLRSEATFLAKSSGYYGAYLISGSNYSGFTFANAADSDNWSVFYDSTADLTFSKNYSGKFVLSSSLATFYSRVKGSDPVNSDEFTTMSWVQSNTVTSGRTLTINGTSYDLSTNRSWSVTAYVYGSNSITGGGDAGSATRYLSLENDSSSPGNNKLYGTNGSGVRGWYDQPSGGGGGISGSGSSGTIPVFTGSTSVGNSYLSQSGGTLYVSAAMITNNHFYVSSGYFLNTPVLYLNNLSTTAINSLSSVTEGFVCYNNTLGMLVFRHSSGWKRVHDNSAM